MKTRTASAGAPEIRIHRKPSSNLASSNIALRTGDLTPCRGGKIRISYIRAKTAMFQGQNCYVPGTRGQSQKKIQRAALTRTHEFDRISEPSSVETRRSDWYPSKNSLSQESTTPSGTRRQAFAFLELLRAS